MASRDIYTTTFDEETGRTLSRTDCPECSGDLETESGETACRKCGLIVSVYNVDHGPEWRTFDETQNRERTGAPRTPARHDRGLSTVIGYDPVHSGRKRRQLNRLRREHKRAQRATTAEQNLMHGLIDIRRLVDTLGLSHTVRDRACTIYRSAQDEGLFQGRSLDSMAAASVYAACRCLGLPRTLSEFEDVTPAERASIRLAYHVLNVELQLAVKPPAPAAFIPRIASKLEIRPEKRYQARKLAEHARERGLDIGCKPSGFATACLYIAAGEYRLHTQAEFAAAGEVTPVTIRTHVTKLEEMEVT